MTHTIHMIGGPTASGKSAKAMEIAAREDGVIINADSVQVYDALPLLTAQPSLEDFDTHPHRLYGYRHPNDACSAGNWREDVMALIPQILADGKVPVVVGGSGLYLKALMEGFSPIPDIPPDVRQEAMDTQERLGNPAFHAALEKIDPVMAGRLHPYHTARLVRAYEVIKATGKSLATFQALPKDTPPEDWDFHVTLVMPERDVLHQRCNDRFLWMMDNGVMDEVEAFDQACADGQIAETSLVHRALGLKPLRAYLHGHMSKDDAVAQAQLETRQYAKRQMTWFRNQIKNEPS